MPLRNLVVRPFRLLARRFYNVSLSVVAALTVLSIAAAEAETFSFHYENIMGTSVELIVEAGDSEAANQAEKLVLDEIDRLSAMLSTYDADSELSKWSNAPNVPAKVSGEVFDLLALSDEWQIKSSGAYHPAAEVLSRLWKRAADEGRVLEDAEINLAVTRAASPLWSLDPATQTATRLGGTPFSLNALGKGFVIDRAVSHASGNAANVTSILSNIGGDILVRGTHPREVNIADPRSGSDEGGHVATIQMANAAIATSGNYKRGFQIGDHRYSHIIDPRNGQPVDHVASATVLALDAATADVLATICSVLKIDESLALINSLADTECLLIERDQIQHTSLGWSRHQTKPLATVKTAPTKAGEGELFDTNYRLDIEFEIMKPRGNRDRYHRPYVAVWIESADTIPVRTLALWMGRERWLRDLRSWYSGDRLRKGKKVDIVDTVSLATRSPGKYKLVWDGKDDNGDLVEAGEYIVLLEAVREHGDYEILFKQISFTGAPVREELAGQLEFEGAVLDYHRIETSK